MSSTTVASSYSTYGAIRIERWPTETPLFVTAVTVSILIWIGLIVSIVGLIYVGILALAFFIMQLGFIAHVRGNGVRLGPDQFPELHARVNELAGRLGMEKVPTAYIMQAGGALNALATRFLRSHFIILFSDLLEACAENQAARDMIIGHELGHIHAGHLRHRWLILPSSLVPFLGSALSRAREFTCDRYGYASAGGHAGALVGLAILAAGGKHGPRVNREALVRQRQDLNTGFMTLGTWFSTHPPLAKRMLVLEPSLGAGHKVSSAGVVRALGIMMIVLLPFVAGGYLVFNLVADRFLATIQAAQSGAALQAAGGVVQEAEPRYTPPPEAVASAQLQSSVNTLTAFLDAELAAGRLLPVDLNDLVARWRGAYPDTDLPRDPYDGEALGYTRSPTGYQLWSSGPDQQPGTDDDIEFKFDRPAR
jgi:Zn-dependent protease with chaperone function